MAGAGATGEENAAPATLDPTPAPMQTLATELAALATWLGQRRDKILHAWRAAVRTDPQLTTGDSLPRAQLYDHIPALLHAFEHKLDPAAAGAVALEE